MDYGKKESLQRLPSVQALLEREVVADWLEEWPRERVVDALRWAVEEERKAVLEGQRDEGPLDAEGLLEAAYVWLQRKAWPGLRPAINATGVVLHTGLGRAPLSEAAAERVKAVSQGNCVLEIDLESGGRGRRHDAIVSKIQELTGAEDALVVNNNAAAVLLALDTLARDETVAVSRGELVEIGGAFRIPEVLRRSGAQLMEVGTTNRTRLQDYIEALDQGAAVLLKVHPSNYKIHGFTAEVSASSLGELGRERGCPVIYDLGSGVLAEQAPAEVGEEPTVRGALEAGVDLVTFSGDKLLGGPQAGIIVGKAERIRALERNHLSRALRPDKMTLAGLEATLEIYLKEDWEQLPVFRMLRTSKEETKVRAQETLDAIRGRGVPVEAWLVEVETEIGGGSLPLTRLPSWGVALQSESLEASTLSRLLRQQELPCCGRVFRHAVILDLRTVAPGMEPAVAACVSEAAAQGQENSFGD